MVECELPPPKRAGIEVILDVRLQHTEEGEIIWADDLVEGSTMLAAIPLRRARSQFYMGTFFTREWEHAEHDQSAESCKLCSIAFAMGSRNACGRVSF